MLMKYGMPKKNKLLLWYWGRRGGGSRYTLELARALKSRDDIELYISLSSNNELLDKFRDLDVPLHVVRTYKSKFSFLISLTRLWLVRRGFFHYIKKNGIESVLSPMPHLWSPFILSIFKKYKIFFISTIHDPKPHLGEYISYPKAMIKREINAANHVICLSESVATSLRNLYNYPRHQVSVCPHGIFSFGQDFTANKWPEENQVFRFLFFGRIRRYKGLPLLLEAFSKLVKEGANVELTIAGNGNVEPFSQLMKTPGIKAQIRWIDESEIPVFYGNCHAVVLPYIAASQSGIWGDAAAFQKPCVVTPMDGLVEQIEDGVTGVIAEEVTVKKYADSMQRIMEPGLYKKLVQNLKKLDQSEEWDSAASKIAQLL